VLNVKTFLSRATVVAVALASFLTTLEAQAQSPSGTSVAVIDLMVVFKAHPRLTTQLEQLKSQMDSYEAYVRNEQKKVQSLAEQLKTLKPGTADYTDKEKQYASLQANLGVQVRQKQREFLEQEAKVRYDAYIEIQKAVADFCERYRIQLVIRFNREDIDASKPQAVMMGVNRPIVYQSQLDITNHIITALGGKVPTETAERTVPLRPPVR
jgi:Skp family chaperone for outer membrane proteins